MAWGQAQMQTEKQPAQDSLFLQAKATEEGPPGAGTEPPPPFSAPVLPPNPWLLFPSTAPLLFGEDPFMCVHLHMHVRFLFQSFSEVFAENLQFPCGLNLAKIAFLTLLGLNSNKPPLY